MGVKKILLVDNHRLVVEGLLSLLRPNGYELFAAYTPAEALELTVSQQPHLIIIDYWLGNATSEELVREIRFRLPETRLLGYSKFRDKESVLRMIDAGAHGFVSKSDTNEELFEAIHALLDQRVYFDMQSRGYVVNRILQADNELEQIFGSVTLSSVDIRIIRLIVQELPAREIGERLFFSDRTIEQYRQRIMRKIGVKTIIGIVKFAVKHGIVQTSEL